jgi:hypothetical protein
MTYSTLWAIPLPDQMGTTGAARRPKTLAEIKVTGAATSVAAGMALANITTDFTYIERIYGFQDRSSDDYVYMGKRGAAAAAGSALIQALTASTGAAVTAATDLSGETFTCLVIGEGPLAGF